MSRHRTRHNGRPAHSHHERKVNHEANKAWKDTKCRNHVLSDPVTGQGFLAQSPFEPTVPSSTGSMQVLLSGDGVLPGI